MSVENLMHPPKKCKCDCCCSCEPKTYGPLPKNENNHQLLEQLSGMIAKVMETGEKETLHLAPPTPSPSNVLVEALKVAFGALNNAKFLLRKYCAIHHWHAGFDRDIQTVKQALATYSASTDSVSVSDIVAFCNRLESSHRTDAIFVNQQLAINAIIAIREFAQGNPNYGVTATLNATVEDK